MILRMMWARCPLGILFMGGWACDSSSTTPDSKPQRDVRAEGAARPDGSGDLATGGAARVLFVADTSQSTSITDPNKLRSSELKRAIDLYVSNPRVSFAVSSSWGPCWHPELPARPSCWSEDGKHIVT